LIVKELWNALDAKSDTRVQKGQKAPLPFNGGKKELEEMEEVQEASWATSRRFIRDAKAASRNPMRDTKTVLRGG
jgi:hypothetical protein